MDGRRRRKPGTKSGVQVDSSVVLSFTAFSGALNTLDAGIADIAAKRLR